MAFFYFLTFMNFSSQGMFFRIDEKIVLRKSLNITQFTCTVILGNRFSDISNHLMRNDNLRAGLNTYAIVNTSHLHFVRKLSIQRQCLSLLMPQCLPLPKNNASTASGVQNGIFSAILRKD